MPKPDANGEPWQAPSRAKQGLLERNPGLAVAFEALLAEAPVEYCDYIAHRIGETFRAPDPTRLLTAIGPVCWDLLPEGGYLLTTRKTLDIHDRNGRVYRVTVEAVAP